MYTHHIYTHLHQISRTFIIRRWATYGSAALWLTRRCRIHKTSADALVKGRKCQVQGVLPSNLSLSIHLSVSLSLFVSPPPTFPPLSVPALPHHPLPLFLSSLRYIAHRAHLLQSMHPPEHTHICVYMCVYLHAYIHALYMHIILILICILYVYVCIYVYMFLCIYLCYI
jgi:hypothetical protein